MIRKVSSLAVLSILWLGLCSMPASGQPENTPPSVSQFSDAFDAFNPDRWQEVLLYSAAKGTVAVESGRLVLRTPKEAASEVQVYSLFTLDGDFDLQAAYDASDKNDSEPCRFNTGIVLQTLGDEKSYKCYMATNPSKELFFRSRLDLSGDKNVEVFKGDPAPRKGTIRVTRKGGNIAFLTLAEGTDQWNTVYTFKEPCEEKLRVRFKLQTGGEEDDAQQVCPAVVSFDDFTVNSCTKIRRE